MCMYGFGSLKLPNIQFLGLERRKYALENYNNMNTYVCVSIKES